MRKGQMSLRQHSTEGDKNNQGVQQYCLIIWHDKSEFQITILGKLAGLLSYDIT